MAGSHPAFNAANFRNTIRSTMEMGLPTATADRPTFQWKTERDYAIDDPAQNPYDWTATPTSTVTHADVQVACAVEFSARPAGSVDTPLGQFDTSRVVLTLLDEDYELIEGANRVVIGGNPYEVDFIAPPTALFEVTIYTIYATAVDES